MRPVWVLIAVAVLAQASYTEFLAAKRKFDQIAKDRLRPGTRVSLTPKELNSYVAEQAKQVAADGLRNPRVELGDGRATGSALIDFVKIREGQGNPPGWLMSRLLSGERPVTVTARIQSGDGIAQVDIERVEISGVPVEGRALDFIIDSYLRSRYPEAKIGTPFELGHRIDRLEIKPGGVGVHIGP
jgi:hypothetical protein